MKFFGWIFFLITIGFGLLLYNLRYLPIVDEHTRLFNENLMWQTQVKELQNKMNNTDVGQQPLFSQTFLWDDLFTEPASFALTEPAQLMLKEIIPKLQETTNEIIIAGHCDNQPILPELKKSYPTDLELSFAKAMVVVNTLQSWGIAKERLVCIGYGATKPVDTGVTPSASERRDLAQKGGEARSKNRRVEIIVKP